MTLDDWKKDEASRKVLSELLANPVMQSAIQTLELHYRAGETIQAPAGFSTQEAICWHHARLAGVKDALDRLKGLPFTAERLQPTVTPLSPKDKPTPETTFWGEASPVFKDVQP